MRNNSNVNTEKWYYTQEERNRIKKTNELEKSVSNVDRESNARRNLIAELVNRHG